VRRSVRFTLAAVVAAVTAAGVVATVDAARPRDAGAVDSETYPLPASGAWTIVGKGYGHGRGMSQWGSQGAALHGRSGSAILDFYYPSTVTTTITSAPIRVLLSTPQADTTVRAQTGLAVRDVATGLLYQLSEPPAGSTMWRAVRDAAGLHLQHGDGTTWTPWTAPDGLDTWAGPLRFGAGTDAILTLSVAGVARAYRGTLTAVPTGTDKLATVNTLAMDLYLRSVVPAESPPYWLAPALQAQAVAARTYAAYGRARSATRAWDICDTTACQVYKGIASEVASTTKAVQDTPNQIRTLSGAPILAEFSASNGGWTVAAVAPYQVAKPDPYDAAGGTNPVANWTTPLTAADVRTRYPQVGNPTALRVVTRTGDGAWGGRITDMWVDGTTGSVQLAGTGTRFGLRSTWWIPAPTAAGPALVPAGSTVTIRGTARAGAAVEVWFHRRNVAGYTKRRDLVADAAGGWSTTYVANDDYRYYAVAYGLQSASVLTRIPH
jgi:stage II sporulation protein D